MGSAGLWVALDCFGRYSEALKSVLDCSGHVGEALGGLWVGTGEALNGIGRGSGNSSGTNLESSGRHWTALGGLESFGLQVLGVRPD